MMMIMNELSIHRAYHAGMKAKDRSHVQDWFTKSSDGIVVSTIAFGMGINKKNIRYIYHYNLPKSLENYAQEIGRAGRDNKHAICEAIIDIKRDVSGNIITDNRVDTHV